MVIDRLVEQDFSEEGARRRFDEIVERYENGWNFRAKPHLLRMKEGIPDDEEP
ncbi:hypothetical protein L0F51_09615 [Afifella sp. H1R]|uniref:hypothetical protein n=1 Tax=Afifella sp. H1R TaxID=2908841 RepID=UPI001F2CABD3|nr:hypothetical protein [Afifella sp. H1R]MCF1504020.1 hypothetical protein [Afifella sp. H1R]